MINYSKLIFIAVFGIPLLSYGGEDNIAYKFIRADSSYEFYGSFYVKAEPDCLINLIYNFDNISDYSSRAESVELIRRGNGWYEIKFTYRKYIFFKHQSTWRRTLDRKRYKVDFIMIANSNNMSMIPEMVSSSGYYQIKSNKENCQVLYYQTCTLKPGFLLDAYINAGEEEAIDFIQEFKEYIEKNCQHLDINKMQKKTLYD
jgi:hypothetical protein